MYREKEELEHDIGTVVCGVLLCSSGNFTPRVEEKTVRRTRVGFGVIRSPGSRVETPKTRLTLKWNLSREWDT